MKSNKLFIIGFLVVNVTLIIFLISSPIQNTFFRCLKDIAHTMGLQNIWVNFPAKVLPDEYFPSHPGFPINYYEWTERASVTIADIQNDGSMELLLPTFAGKIHAWNASGTELPNFPIDTTGWRIRGRLALGDLDHDGELEIAAGLESASNGVAPRVSIWQPDGQVMSGWPKTTDCAQSNQLCSVTSIVLADLDKDSNLEVIAATNNRDLTSSDPSRYVPNLYVWKSDGQLAPGSWPNEDEHNVAIIGQIAVGDLDGDTYPDIVTGRDYNRLFAFNRLGANLNGWPHYVWWPYDNNNWADDQIEFPRSAPALADLDQDGDLEYIIPGLRRHATSSTYYATDLLVYTATGDRFPGWELPASGNSLVSSNTIRMIEAPAIADLTGDKRPEIILATQDGWVRAYKADKQLLWSYNYAQGKEIHTSETVIGDVDGDGWNEVVFGTFAINLDNVGPVGLYILDHNGSPKPGTPIWVSAPGISSSPALGDVDGDGLIEIAAATYSGSLYMWDAPGQALPERLPWPMARHDLQRTALSNDPLADYTQSSKTASTPTAVKGDTITFRIHLVNTGDAMNDALNVTDVIPSGLSYVAGSLHASAGLVNDSLAPTLQWSGAMEDLTPIDIWYNAKVTQILPMLITNTAIFDTGSTGDYPLYAWLIVNGKKQYLPFLLW